MIRQAISCDICGAEKKQTNHWFVACEQGGELRVSAWGSPSRLRTGSRHLCGQACMHKLVDDFMARVIGGNAGARPPETVVPEREPETPRTRDPQARDPQARDIEAPFDDAMTSPARVLSPISPLPGSAPRLATALVSLPERPAGREAPPRPEPPLYTSRNWRAEAWERERERSLRGADRGQTPIRRVVN